MAPIQDQRISASSSSLSWLTAAGLSAAAIYATVKLADRIRRPGVSLRDKVAVITGGSRGLGFAVAEEFAESGCRVALVARDHEELEEAARRLRAHGHEAEIFACDITNKSELAPLLDRIVAHFGKIDILVNNAGLIKVAPVESLTHADFEEAMNLMFWGPLNLTFAALPHLRHQGGGHIVNITSVGGRVAVPHLLAYCCAKFALVGFSTGLSAELNPDQVHVLTVVPGLMRTGSYLNAKFKGDAEHEFAWFSLLGNLPGFSVDAGYAAQAIREALQRRQATCTISLPATVLTQAEALIPEAMRTAMQFTNRMLPSGTQDRSSSSGKVLNPAFGKLFHALTALGRSAAGALNE